MLTGICLPDLDNADADENPLHWWLKRVHVALLFPVAQILFAIPALSAEDEWAFSDKKKSVMAGSEEQLERYLLAAVKRGVKLMLPAMVDQGADFTLISRELAQALLSLDETLRLNGPARGYEAYNKFMIFIRQIDDYESRNTSFDEQRGRDSR